MDSNLGRNQASTKAVETSVVTAIQIRFAALTTIS
jgi:hypothetical protein